MSRYILILDLGTTSVRACLMDENGAIVARVQEPLPSIYPQPGWVEQDARLIWHLARQVATTALAAQGIDWREIAAVGLTNQRETTVLWDKTTGEPVHHAIVWQCRRTAGFCEQLQREGYESSIAKKTGLVADAYFSASKIRWLLDHSPQARECLAQNRLLFGTVDSWILWNLSGRKVHATDITNASRTMLYNIHQKCWDEELLTLFGVPAEILPQVQGSAACYGMLDPTLSGGVEVPLAGIAGDQQAALFGQRCWTAGEMKSTYGTGAFLVMNTGADPIASKKGLLTTLAAGADGGPAYALEGSVFFAGATLEWLARKLNALEDFRDIDRVAGSLESNEGVYLVPAFAGLGAPHWKADARTAVFGLTQDSGKPHLVRAALEAMAYQTWEVVEAMRQEAGLSMEALRVDGGVTQSRFLSQFLADILNVAVVRTDDTELTAKGAGYLAGLAVGFWKSSAEIARFPEETEYFEPAISQEARERCLAGWQDAMARVLQKDVRYAGV